MVTIGVDHSVLDRSFMILENEHALTEDKVAACTELEGYFSQLIRNKTDLLPPTFNVHGEKLIRTLLQCLEKDNSKLRTSVLLVLKPAVQLLPKRLGMGLQLASQCYSILLKISRATEENVKPSCKSRALVELFQCLVIFDDPQFLDAVMTATVRYSDHKELIEKCVNVGGETVDSSWNKQQDRVSWMSALRLEALCFAKRLMRVCGSLMREQFEKDLGFWLEILLPSVFVFHEVYSCTYQKEADTDTRKAGREALGTLLVLVPKDWQLKLEKWPKIKKDIKDSYSDKMVKLVGVADDWASIWCLVLDVLGAELIKKGNNHLINKLLNVEEKAFKSDRLDVRVQAFICWRHLIDRLLPSSTEVPHDAVPRSVRLLVQPLQPNNAKTDVMSRQKLNTWWHLVQRLENCIEYHRKIVLVPFLVYCFGCAKSKELPPGKKFAVLHIPCAEALANILDHEPAKQQTSERQKDNKDVEEDFIHPCKVPLLTKPAVFLDVSDELLYAVGECAVILSSRSEVERCSQLLCRIWNSFLRHVAVVMDDVEIPGEKVVKLIQDLLRLLQNLTERASSTAPALATNCIGLFLEGLVMGPYALPPAILSSPTYYVGTTQLMTGTAALFLIELMVSRPLLQSAVSHAQYIPVLKAVLDVGISRHNVLEFTQSVMKQLETVTSSYYNINSEEEASLCTVWGIIAAALTICLKDQNHVNQGNEKHHDLSCFYLVVLFPFYHFYSITYKQAMEILPMWLELYKSFHKAAICNVPTLDINEVCETVAMKICQALVKHCPTSSNEAVPLLKAVQNIIMMIPYGDICGTRQSSKSKSRYLLLPDRGCVSKPTNYITNSMNLVVKVSHLFSVFERSGEWYNTVGALIMSCLETLFKNMKAASVTAAIPMVASLSNSILSFLQVNPLQDGSTKFWHESLHRMWKCYFTFIEAYLPQKSVKDFLGWMSALLEAGFRHPVEEIRHVTTKFWDNVVIPAFAKDNTNVPQVLKEARKNYTGKSGQIPNIFCIVSDDVSDTFSHLDAKGKPLDSVPDAIFVLPEETEKPSKHRQSLLRQLQDEGRILTKHQKEVFRRRKDDIPALYNSTIQPVQEDSLISESSQDTSDFAAPQRVIEPLRNDTIALEAKELLIASSLKVLEPPSSLQRLAEYRKKMMIDHEGSIVLASISGNNSPVSADIPKQPVLSHEILDTQVQAESEPPNSPLSLTLLSDHCEPTTLPSNGRKLNLEFVAVRLPTSILVPSKDTPELPESELVHEQDISVNPEVAIRVSISTPAPTSVASGGIDAPVSFPLEEPAVCQDVIMRSSKQGHPDSHNILASPVELQEILELPTASLAVLTDKNISPRASDITNIVPGSSNPLLIEASNKNKTGSVQKVDHSTKSSTRKPVVVNTDNPLTNYFKPVSITLTADDDEVDSRKGSARTIHLSLETLDNNVTTSVISEPCLLNPETPYESQQILPKLTEIVEDSHVTSVSIVEASVGTQSSDVECEVSDWRKTLSPVKVVVEKVEDFILTKTFSALETTPPLNIEHDKELPLNEVSSSSRRKIKSPLKRNPGDPKLPPFKGNSKIAQQMETKVQHKEAIPEARLSKSGSKYVKRKDSKKPKALKRSSRSRSASKRGTDDKVTKVTVEEAITGPETASVDNPSPSLLPVASGRSQSVVKKTRSRKTHNKVNENIVAMPQNREISSLPTIESQQKLKILKSVEANKCNSKSRESSSIKDLNDSSQVVTASNESSLAHDKKQAFNVEIDRQNSHGPSKARVRKVAGCNCNSVSNEAVDVKVMKREQLDVTEPMKLCAKLEEKVIKEKFSGSKVPSKLTKRESLKSKTEARLKDVKFTKQNISESDGTLSKKVLATDTEICEPSVVNNIETLKNVHNEMLTDNIKPCDPNPFNSDELLAIGIKNETLPCLETFEPESSGLVIENENVLCLETSTETRTSKEDPYNLRKGGQDDVDEMASESNDSHKHSGSVADDVRSGKRSVKSVFPKVKVVNYTPVLETSVLQPKEEIIISSNDTNSKPSARFGKFTSKLKSAVTLLGSSEKEIDQDKPADIVGETACSLKMGGALSLLTSGTETFELHNTEVEHEEENSERTQHNHSLIHIEHVSSERRKRKFNETGLKDDLNAVQMSIKRCASSHHQSALRTSIIEEDLVPLLRKDVKSSLSKNPEMLVASPVTAAAGEITVLGVTGTAALLTSTEASAVTSPMLTDVVPAVCSSEEGILPAKSQILPELIKSLSDKSIEKGMSVQSFEKEDFSISVNANTDGFHKEKVTSHEKMVTRQRSRCSAFNVKTLCDIQSSRKLCSSATRLDENIKTVVGYDTARSGLKRMSSSQKPMKVNVPYLNTRESMNSKFEASECSEELDVQTSKTVSSVVTLSQKEIFKESSMSKLDLKTSLRCEETSFSESEVTLPCFETENTSTGSEEVQTEFQKVADSEDVIESSQDLSASSLIASRFPLMHKCSVSVCRIDTILDPGVKVNISQGDQKLVVLMPEHCNSPFKVYTPGSKTPTDMQEEKSATAKSEMEETYRLKLLPATRTLYGNSSDINQMDSVQDKPSIPLGSNSSIGDSMKESANKVSVDSVSTSGDDIPKPRSEKETITSKCEGNILSVAKTDTTESKGGVPVVTADYVSESRSNEQIRVSDVVMNVGPRKHRPQRYNTLKSEGGVPLVVDDTSYLRFKHQSKSESDESIALVTENYTSKSASKQQFDKPTTANSVLMTLKCDTLKLRTREQTNMLRPEDNISAVMVSENGISTAAEEGAPEHRCLQQINRLEFQDNVSAIKKEDTLKHQFEQQQQINVTLSDVNVPVVGNEDTPKPQTMEHINTSELQDNVSSSGKEDILTPQSEEWINTLSEVNISIVSTGYTPKRRSKQQIDTSKSGDDVSVVCKEDTPKRRSKQQIDTSKSGDDVSVVWIDVLECLLCKQLKRHRRIWTYQSVVWIDVLECLLCKQQIDTSKSGDDVSVVCKEDTPKRRSKQQIDTSKSGDEVSVVCKEYTPKRQSKQQIDTSKSSDDVSVVCKEDTPKRRSKQQIDTSKSSDDVSVVCKEDTPKLRSKQQITYESVLTVGKEDKPTLRSKRLTSTSKSEEYILKASKECIQKPQCRKQVNTLVTNSNVLILKNEETPKLRTRQQCNRSKSVDKVSRTSKRDGLKPISKKQINMSSTVNVPPSMNEDSDKRQSKKHVNTSKSDVCEGDGLKSQSKQQIDTSVVESNALMVDSEDNPKLQSRQPVSENNVITGSSEDNPKQESKRQINTSEFGKEDTSKPQLKQQIINTSEFECNVSRVSEKDFPKPQSKHEVNVSVCECGVSSVVSEDSTEPHSKQQINISDSEGIISSVRKEDILKYQFKTQIDVSVLKNDVSAVRSEDTQKLESRQQINTSDSADNISVVGREDPPVPQSNHQINTSVSECNEEVRRLRSKHRLSTPISEACVSTKRKYGSIKPHPKQEIGVPYFKGKVLSSITEDAEKPQSKQEINSSASEDGIIQQQINILKCQDNVFTDVKGVLKPPSKQQIETSESETFISTTTEEDTSLSKSKQQIDMSESEITPLIAASKSTFKHRVSGLKSNSAIVTDLTKQSKQSENENVSVMRDDAPKLILKPELGSSNVDESIKICAVDDTTELSSKCSGIKRKVDQDSEVVSDTEIQGSKIIFSYSEKVLGEAELVEDEARRLVTPKSVTIDHFKDKGNKKIKEDIISKLDDKTSGADDILKAFAQEKTSDGHFIDISDINKALESNDTNISAVDSKLASPLRPRKRSASSSRVALEVSLGQVDSNINDHVDTGISKTKRLSHNAENVNEESVCDRSPVGTPSQCNNTLSDNDKALLPSSPKSLLSSPRSLLRAFSSPLGSLESNQTQKNHRKRSTGGRAQYMVGLAVAVNDVGTSQASSPVVPQKSEEIRSIAATPPLSSRKLPCGVSDAGTESSLTPLERLQCSVSECETPSPSCVSSLAEIPYKRVLKQSGEQGTPPSKKKRVWFPDPEVSGTRLFSTHDAVDSACTSISKRRSPHSPTRMLLGRRRKARTQCAAVSIDTDIHDKSSDPALSTATTPYAEETSPQSQSSPDLTGVTSQGSVEETATELLNSQDAFFPALINCNHPIECVAPRLTTHVMWTKALVVELTRKNIHTIGDLSRLDEASINRLPIANPKISHAKTILQDYVKSLEVESDRSPSIISKGGVSRSEDAHLEPESVLSSPSPSVRQPISTADVVKFFVTNEGSLATVLEEASKVGDCSRRLHQEVLSVLKGSNSLANSTAEVMEESVSDVVARFGRGAVLDHIMNSDGLDKFFGELPKVEVIKYFVKHDPDGLCKILSESSAPSNKTWQGHLYRQLASGQPCHKELFDTLLSADRNNTLLSSMQSFIMLKRSTEEILQKMPVESVMQYATSGLSLMDKIGLCVDAMSHDTSAEVPVRHCQELVEAVAKKVSQREFTTIYYNVVMDNLS